MIQILERSTPEMQQAMRLMRPMFAILKTSQILGALHHLLNDVGSSYNQANAAQIERMMQRMSDHHPYGLTAEIKALVTKALEEIGGMTVVPDSIPEEIPNPFKGFKKYFDNGQRLAPGVASLTYRDVIGPPRQMTPPAEDE